MKLRKLSISNFRGIKELEYTPSATNLLIGPNNSGKTTILRAMDCVLNPYKQWYRQDSITEFDFFDRSPDLHPLSVEAWLDSLEPDELAVFDDALEGVGPDGKVVAEAQDPAEALGMNPIVRFRFEAKPDGTGYSSAITYPKHELQPQVTEMIKGIEHIGDTLRSNPRIRIQF
jgi:predicted ATP-dependent endonuclease of OLD family